MDKIFLDTNVIIDFLIDREPFSENAARIFNKAEKEEIRIMVSALSFSNIYYIIRRVVGHNKTLKILQELTDIVEIMEVNKNTVYQAIASGFKDFEDAMQHYSACTDKDITALITRNTKDYKNSELPVFTPETYLKTVE